jgi:UPF0176 protein
MDTGAIGIAAFYKFLSITSDEVAAVRADLEQFAREHDLKGLVVLGTEGINATVAGTPEVIAALKEFVRSRLSAPDITFKDSSAEKMPFARFKVDVRSEIVTTKNLEISVEDSRGTYLSPKEWHEMLASDSDIVVVDTRNDYETEVGIFEGAVDPKIKKFSDFKHYVEREGLPRDKKLLLYCTGGIRCEKAVPEVKQLGYENVYQLEGGILRYLEEYPDGHFKGECFVFDHRVAVDSNLQPSKKYKLCPHCGNPAQEAIQCNKCGTAAVVCHRCVEREDLKSCSKNCAHHIRLRKERESGARRGDQE